MDEACRRLGGRDGLLTKPSVGAKAAPQDGEQERLDDGRNQLEGQRPADHLEDDRSGGRRDVEYIRLTADQKSRERRRMGYVG